jgi:hypothetical protein
MLPLIVDKNDIVYFHRKYSLNKEDICKNKITKISTRSLVIYNVLCNVYKMSGLQRKMICYLPIAFINTKTINNNIGIIWIEFDDSMSIEDLEKQIQKNKYQALATNFFLRYQLDSFFRKKEIGSNVRKNVDVVLTSTYYNAEYESNLHWSYDNVAEYPFYVCLSTVFMNDGSIVVNETITSNTFRYGDEVGITCEIMEQNGIVYTLSKRMNSYKQVDKSFFGIV